MRILLGIVLLSLGTLILFLGDRPLKIKEGKIIKFLDFLKTYPPELRWLAVAQGVILKVALGGVFLFFGIMILLGKL